MRRDAGSVLVVGRGPAMVVRLAVPSRRVLVELEVMVFSIAN
jgi:hypothetical protein